PRGESEYGPEPMGPAHPGARTGQLRYNTQRARAYFGEPAAYSNVAAILRVCAANCHPAGHAKPGGHGSSQRQTGWGAIFFRRSTDPRKNGWSRAQDLSRQCRELSRPEGKAD